MILQTPESIILKAEDARSRLGNYLMVGVIFRHGFIFGKTYHRRLHTPFQWAWLASPYVAGAIIGDLGDLKTLKANARDSEREIELLMGSRYITAAALAKSARRLFLDSHKQPDALAVEMSVVDSRENRFWLVDIDGRMRHFSDFIIAGCRSMSEFMTFDKLSAEEQALVREVQEMTSTKEIVTGTYLEGGYDENKEDKQKQPLFSHRASIRKPATAFLEAKSQEKPFSSLSRSEAFLLLCETLMRFEPSSRHDQIELIVYERKGKRLPEALESIIIDRNPKVTS